MAIPTHYETRYEWTGEGERGKLNVPDYGSVPVGAPGEEGRFSPEHMLLGAAEACLLNTFAVIAGMSQMAFLAYRSTATGELEFVPREGYRFVRIVIRPVVTVEERNVAKAERIIEKAHKACLVTRSLNCEVVVEPEIVAG